MADGVFNIAKGRVVELVNRVDSNDPANSALVVIALKASGIESDATLQDYDTVAGILAAANDEATNAGYARIVLTDSDLATPAPDDTNNRFDIDIPDPVWAAVAEAGGAWAKLIVVYDGDTTGGTDANLIPLTHHDFAITPDGSKITAEVAVAGFFRAS